MILLQIDNANLNKELCTKLYFLFIVLTNECSNTMKLLTFLLLFQSSLWFYRDLSIPSWTVGTFGEIGHNMEFDFHACSVLNRKDNYYSYSQHLDNQFLSNDESLREWMICPVQIVVSNKRLRHIMPTLDKINIKDICNFL